MPKMTEEGLRARREEIMEACAKLYEKKSFKEAHFMYIVNIAIKIDKLGQEQLQSMLEAHSTWFMGETEKKNFLLAGPYLDWQGAGIIIAKSMPRKELDAILAQDVFYADGLATYDVHEFKAAKVLPEILEEQ